MKKTLTILSSILMLAASSIAATTGNIKESSIVLVTETGDIKGILREPITNDSNTVAIIISGGLRTDRDGNQPQTKNNSLKMLAEELVAKNIAVLNYDKRGIGESLQAGKDEAKVTLDTYIDDVKGWIELLKNENGFANIIVIGHGEGALIGIMATIENLNVRKLISIASTSAKASETTKRQFESLAPNVKNPIFENIEKLERGERIANVPAQWNLLFRSSLQPYLISLYKHDPKEEIAKLSVPALIIQGNTDIQATEADAALLAAAYPSAEKVIIENMNYVLKECAEIGYVDQLDTYLKSNHPLNKELVPTIHRFILE